MVLFSHQSEDVPHVLYGAVVLGWCGVDLFFVLSGFLITGGLLRTKTASNYFESFYGRRILRIFPVFYLALAITFGILPHFISSPPLPPPHDYLYYWLYLNNWAPLMQILNNTQFVGHFWSLAVEEQFYLVWPAVVLWVSRKHLYFVASLGVLCAPLLRAALVHSGVQNEVIYRNSFCRVDSLMVGVLCALLVSEPQIYEWVQRGPLLLFWCGWMAWAGSAYMLGGWYIRTPMLIWGMTSNAVGFGLVLLGCLASSPWNKILSWTPLRLIGMWSYGIYVYHAAFVQAAQHTEWLHPGVVRLVSVMGMSTIAAALSFYGFERPILRMKDRFAPKWVRADETSPTPGDRKPEKLKPV